MFQRRRYLHLSKMFTVGVSIDPERTRGRTVTQQNHKVEGKKRKKKKLSWSLQRWLMKKSVRWTAEAARRRPPIASVSVFPSRRCHVGLVFVPLRWWYTVQNTATGILSSSDPVCVGGKANTATNPVSTEGLFNRRAPGEPYAKPNAVTNIENVQYVPAIFWHVSGKKKEKEEKNLHLFQRCREELFIESTAEAVNPANLKHWGCFWGEPLLTD